MTAAVEPETDDRRGTWDGRVLATRRVRVLAAAVLVIDWVASGSVRDVDPGRTVAILGAMVLIAVINKIEKRPRGGAWPVVAIVVDLAWTIAVCLLPGQPDSAPWIVLAVPVLTGIVNFGLPAGLVTWGVAAIGYLGGLIAMAPTSNDLSAFPAQMSVGVRQAALLLLVSIPAGYLTEQLAVELNLQTLATALARRRGGLLKRVAERGTGLAKIDADALALLCGGVADLGFDGADVVEWSGGAWERRGQAGAPIELPDGPEGLAGVGAEPLVSAAAGTVTVALGSEDRAGLVLRASSAPGDPIDDDRVDAVMLLVRQAVVAVRNGDLVTELRQLRDDLQYEATHDTLTGLSNRAALMDELGRAEQSGSWSSGRVALLLLDLDGFKAVNDRRGHEIGDELLKVVTARLSAAVGESGRVSRLGGDEFTVLLVGPSSVDAESIGAALVRALTEPFELGGEVEHIGSSIGVARSELGVPGPELMRRADVAMYQAKQAGRGCVRHYEVGLDQDRLRRLDLRADLPSVTELGGFALAYQPIARGRGRRIVGFEALLRWEHPVHGIVPAEEVVELARVVRQSAALTNAVIERAAIEMGHTVGRDRPVEFVTVNVAPEDITSPWLASAVSAAFSASALPRGGLVLEVNEAVGCSPGVARAVTDLRALGARVLIDDWGRESTTLAQLHLPVDGIKLHRVILDSLDDETGRVLLGSVVEVARRRGLAVVAKGIERPSDVERAERLGCQYLQGYLVGEPAGSVECLERLRSSLAVVPSTGGRP